jgi:hypothetical protein
LAEDEKDSKGQEKFRHMARFVGLTKESTFYQDAENSYRWGSDEKAKPEVVQIERDRISQIGPQHVEGRVSNIQYIHQPEDQRKTRSNQKKEQTVSKSMNRLHQVDIHGGSHHKAFLKNLFEISL